MAAIITLVDVCREVGLQDDRTKVVANQAADGELALLLVARDWAVQIGGVIGDRADLPLAEFLRRGQVDVQEVRIAAAARTVRARRYLLPVRDTIRMDAPDGICGQVPAAARIAEGEALIDGRSNPTLGCYGPRRKRQACS